VLPSQAFWFLQSTSSSAPTQAIEESKFQTSSPQKCVYIYRTNHYLSLKDKKQVNKLHWRERERESVCVCPQPAHYVGPWLVQGYPKGFHWRESRTEGIVAFWAPSKYRGTFGSSLMSCPCCWRCQTNRVCTQLYGHSKWTRQKCPPNTISHFMHVSHNKYNLSFLECMQLYLKKIQFSFPSFNSKLIKFNHHQILY
jgi:hypothetical protein